jgi:hypothetical protein
VWVAPTPREGALLPTRVGEALEVAVAAGAAPVGLVAGLRFNVSVGASNPQAPPACPTLPRVPPSAAPPPARCKASCVPPRVSFP